MSSRMSRSVRAEAQAATKKALAAERTAAYIKNLEATIVDPTATNAQKAVAAELLLAYYRSQVEREQQSI